MRGKIEGIGKGGKGVLFLEDRAIFIPYVIDGEIVEFEIKEKKHKVWQGEAKKILEKSPNRRDPFCKYYEKCGGCNFQHIIYEHQLKLKRKILETNLKIIAKLDNFPQIKIINSKEEKYYRTKAVFKIREGKVGFFERNSNKLIEIGECPLMDKKINEKLNEIKNRGEIKKTKKGEIFIISNGKHISAVLKKGKEFLYLTEKKYVKFKLINTIYSFLP